MRSRMRSRMRLVFGKYFLKPVEVHSTQNEESSLCTKCSPLYEPHCHEETSKWSALDSRKWNWLRGVDRVVVGIMELLSAV